MKRIILLSITIGFLFVGTVMAQQDTRPVLDSRAAKHYTVEQVAEMSDVKILQLNFLYTSSFFIDKSKLKYADKSKEKIVIRDCPTVSPGDIDVANYELARKRKQRVSVPYTDKKFLNEYSAKGMKTSSSKRNINPNDGDCYCIVLLSWEEVQKEYQKIEDNYNSRK
ncbi:MAG: hypothetical protein KKA07_00485 [Bacteroidetes bacterium]|nr:hypothetical protein [Bacteroidota bacterium]MBU1717528.1 hypothetical protein [Bacteroidota bacterium]